MTNTRHHTGRHGRRRNLLAAAVEACEPRRLLASVSGTVFNDADQDGVRDSGEAGVSGVTVFADRNFNGVMTPDEPRVVTDANGFYRIAGIVADGTSTGVRLYSIGTDRITAPAGGGHSARFASDYEAANRNFGLRPGTAVPPPQPTTGYFKSRVIRDANANGRFDAGESALVGVRAYDDANNNRAFDAGERSVLTDGNGEFTLTLPAFEPFAVRVTLVGSPYDPAAYRQTSPASGEASTGTTPPGGGTSRDFIAFAPVDVPPPAGTATVAGTVYTDADRDGVLDAGEAGVAGVTVYADINYNGVREAHEPITTTNANGTYSLGGIPLSNNSIAIRALAPAGRTFVNPSNGAQSGRYGATITYAGRNFGLAPATTAPTTGGISFQPFYDDDRDGVRDAGEAAAINASVWLDLDRDGLRDAGEPLVAQTSPGVYTASGVAPGTYAIAFRPDGDFNEYADFFTDVTVTAGATATRIVPVVGGGNVLDVTAFYDADNSGTRTSADTSTTAFIIWVDSNGNGLRDAGERPLEWNSYDMAGIAIYRAYDLAADTYKIALRRPGDADLYADYSITVTVRSGSGITEASILVPTTSSLGGVVYNDADGDGTRDGGEAGTGGVTVFADYDFDGVRDANEPQTATLSDGTYKLYGIRSDNVAFRITAVAPVAGATFTQPAAGYYQARFDRAYDLASQGGRDFGYRFTASAAATVSGRVYSDADVDGFFYTGDAATPGVTVYADRDYDGVRDAGEPVAVTDSAGRYTLSIPIGPNSVAIRLEGVAANRITQPSGGVYSGKYTAAYKVENADFGIAPVAFTGRVFLDADKDGTKDAGEGWAAGAVVFVDVDGDGKRDIFGGDGIEPVATVDANGFYVLRAGAAAAGKAVGVVDFRAPYYATADASSAGQFVEGSLVYSARRGFVGTTGFSAAANPLLGAVGASFVSVTPKTFFQEDTAKAASVNGLGYSPAELANRFIGGLTGWRDVNANGVRDAGEPVESDFQREWVDGDGSFYYSLVVRDGDPFRLALATDYRVGAAAKHVFSGVGSAGMQRDYSIEVKPSGSVVTGQFFYDNDRNGVSNSGDYGGNPFYGDAFVYADYDNDGVHDADEPIAMPIIYPDYDHSTLYNYFFLYVDSNRPFRLRLGQSEYSSFPRSIVQTSPAVSLSIPPQTLSSIYKVGGYYAD